MLEKSKEAARFAWLMLVRLPNALDWMVDVMTALLVLALGGAALWIAWSVLSAKDPNAVLMESVPHWPAVAILLVPLLYRPVTTFLKEVEEVAGARRRRAESAETETVAKKVQDKEPRS